MTTDRYRGFTFDEAALREDVDLDADRRKEILYLEATAQTATHWEALDLPWNAPADAAKAAYLERVKVFHPDRYAGKRLGSYRGRLERVFRRITEARDVLADEGRRAAYARVSAPADQFAALEARRLEDERRTEERRARLARSNPIMARVARVKELVDRGRTAFEEGRFSQAANDLQIALSMDPSNREVATLVADARRKAAAMKAGELYDKGWAAEVIGRPHEAVAHYTQALEADPGHVRSAAAATRTALALGDVARARGFADAAMKAGPRVAAALEAMGMVLEAEGQKKEARQMLERAVDLDPKLESAKERLKKLRWSFLG
ncbi:MAG: tetratricopeptide repeat protein [Anaeromyxobacteraceae bacterium]